MTRPRSPTSRCAQQSPDGRTPWAGRPAIWTGPKQYDLAPAEEAILTVLRKNPDAIVIPDFWVLPYQEWGLHHLDDVWQDEQGRYAYSTRYNISGWTDDPHGVAGAGTRAYLMPSQASPVWRRDAATAVSDVVARLAAGPFRHAIGGFFFTGGVDGQFVTKPYDYSPASYAEFAGWLKDRYHTVARMNTEWGSDYAAFGDVTPPTRVWQGDLESGGPPVLDPGPRADYYIFKWGRPRWFQDALAKAAKASMGKQIVTLSYRGWVTSEDTSELQHLDALGSPDAYPYRKGGHVTGIRLNDRMRGMTLFNEIDTRTWVGNTITELNLSWLSAATSIEEFRTINRKLTGLCLAKGYGYWYYDMAQYFNAPSLREEIGTTYAAAQRVLETPANRVEPDVCLIISDTGDAFVQDHGVAGFPMSTYSIGPMLLKASGVPYDEVFLDDLLRQGGANHYRVLIFWTTTRLTDHQRKVIRQRFQNKGRTLVFAYDSGYIGERGKSLAEMAELIGMGVSTGEGHYVRQTALNHTGGDPLLDGVERFSDMGETAVTEMSTDGKASWIARPQQFWVDDADAVPLAEYADNGRTAAAVKRNPDWTSVYVGPPAAWSPVLLNNIAREAGAYVLGTPGHEAYAGTDKFAMVHALHSGSYTLNLPPGRQTVTDALTGERLAHGDSSYTFDVVAEDVRWFLFT